MDVILICSVIFLLYRFDRFLQRPAVKLNIPIEDFLEDITIWMKDMYPTRRKFPSIVISNQKSKLAGEYKYYSNEIIIYLRNHPNIKSLVDTQIHETIHHIFIDTKSKQDLLNNYERHLINKSVSLATVASYMKDLRVVINHCKNNLEDFPETYNVPFGSHGYSIKSNFGLKKVMGFKELDLVLNFKDFKSEFDEFALDIWQLLFYSNGINFIDALILKWENIHSDVIRIMRRKTLTTRKNNIKAIQIPIDSQIDRIIKRWGVKNNKYLLGLIDNEFNEKHLYSRNKLYRRKINSSLKAISNQLNLSVPLRIKTARETYATSLFRLGAPKDQIGEMMGHSNSKVTEHYFGSLGVEIVSEINKKLPRPKE